MKETRHLPPSRIRYERNHPTVSFRVTLDERRRLEAFMKKTGQPLRAVVVQTLGLLEARIEKIEKARKDGYRAGWGRFEAPCSVCGKPLKFDIKTERDAKDALMAAFAHWRHTTECWKQ